MGRGLWSKIGRFFAGGAAGGQLDAVQRLLVEADFGVAATNETVERLSRAATPDAASLERIVAEQLGPPGAPLARAPALGAQPGEATERSSTVGLRDRWWLFVIALAALATEWALRRRQGLP